jgi:acyl transferase domain-containing protein
MLQHKILVPTLHFKKPNPKLDIENTPFYVIDKLSDWSPEKMPRRAGLNSFGVGGTNAHAVLEEAPTVESGPASRPWHLLTLSARTESALERSSINLARHFKENGQQRLGDVAYTLQSGRKAFKHRLFLLARDVNEAVNALDKANLKQVISRVCDQKNKEVVFMFPGQGSQYINMGLEIYRNDPTFKEQIDRCAEVLKPLLGIDLRHVLYPTVGEESKAADILQQTAIAQPAIFTVEYALAKLWMEWGISPQKMIGHSVGEFAAACLSGVFSLDDALALVSVRGRLMQALPSGAMLAVTLTEEELSRMLPHDVALAAVNGPSNCVVSGPNNHITALEQQFIEKEIPCRYLHTSHAFHSSMMDPVLEAFTEQIRRLKLAPPRIPFISSSTGTWVTPEESTDPTYWTMNVRKTVRFHSGRQELGGSPDHILLEVGPGNVLTTLARHPSYNSPKQTVLSSLGPSRETRQEIVALLTALGELWLDGVVVDWNGFYAHEKRCRVSLPTYPFEKKRYWVDTLERTQGSQSSQSRSTDLTRERTSSPLLDVPAVPVESTAPRSEPCINSGLAENTKSNAAPVFMTSVESLMSEQLRVMEKQLELLQQWQTSSDTE